MVVVATDVFNLLEGSTATTLVPPKASDKREASSDKEAVVQLEVR